MQIQIKKGLDVPMAGRPELTISNGKPVSTVGLVGFDTPGLKPRMAVAVGDRVKRGQALYIDKRNPEVKYTAPAAGTIQAVNRGGRRVLEVRGWLVATCPRVAAPLPCFDLCS